MFHPAKLKTGQNNKIVLGKRICNAGILFKPMERCHHLPEDNIQLGYFLRIGLPVISSDGTSVPGILPTLQLSGYKREQVCTKRFGRCKTDGLTIVGYRLTPDVCIRNSFPVCGKFKL